MFAGRLCHVRLWKDDNTLVGHWPFTEGCGKYCPCAVQGVDASAVLYNLLWTPLVARPNKFVEAIWNRLPAHWPHVKSSPRTMLRDNEDTIGEYVRLLIQSLHSHVVSNEPHQVQDLGNQIFDALDVNEDGSLTKDTAKEFYHRILDMDSANTSDRLLSKFGDKSWLSRDDFVCFVMQLCQS